MNQNLRNFTVFDKYASYLSNENRRETYEEVISRYTDYFQHKFPSFKEELIISKQLMLEGRILPSMRALENNTPIITKNGWKTVKEVKVGDVLYSSDGKETVVEEVYPFENIPLLEIEFSDKAKLIACEEHLWLVSTTDDLLTNKTRVVDTLFIKKHLKQAGKNNITIWNCSPIEREEAILEVDPYILGAWLGDGYSNGTQISTSVEDSAFSIEQYEKSGYKCKQSMSSNIWTWNVQGLRKDLLKYNLVNNKHIPEIYLRGSIGQRLALLQGLMDTDGCITSEGRCLFTNTNINIIEGFKELLSSLGIKYTFNQKKKRRAHHLDTFNISFFTCLPVARMPRKAVNIRSINTDRRTDGRKVFSVVEVGLGNATCFKVDSADRSFLVGKQMIVTHNCLQFSGVAADKNPARIYNCSYLPVTELEAFREILFLLLGGSGVGFSVQKHHTKKLPTIHKSKYTFNHIIEDTIQGWGNAVDLLIKSYYSLNDKPQFVYRDIRPKGSPLSSGGKAPGPDPLRKALFNIELILDKKVDGDKLRPIEIHDIVCHLADAVLSGGVRRAALISLFSFEDYEMRTCKTGLNLDLNPQRYRANNSAAILKNIVSRQDFMDYLSVTIDSKRGEPGIFLTNDNSSNLGLNPCAEISLNPFQFCNLTTINAKLLNSQGDFDEAAKYASFLGTLQASLTDFNYLRGIWRETTEREALLGVSMTGIMENKKLYDAGLDMTKAANVILKTNEEYAAKIGINKAARTTALKPEGTTSCVLGTSSGIHPAEGSYYIRRAQIDKSKALYKYLEKNYPNMVVDYHENPANSAVIEFACRSNEETITKDELSAIEHLNIIKKVFNEWVKPGHRSGINHHNVSASVYYNDSEAAQVKDWLWANKDSYSGITLFPKENWSFKQAPFEPITREEYERRINLEQEIDFTKVIESQDETQITEQLACAGSSCEVKFD